MKTFKELGLNAHLQQSLEELGYIEATPIQEESIPFLLENEQDLIGLAQTGTGKTAAFGLPILHKLTQSKDTQAIVLCPTRELCLQISREMAGFAKHSKHVSIAAVYGGEPIDGQIRQIRAGANVIIGTPGRVHDLIRRKILKMQTIRFVVLDEADEMLDMGFKEDLDDILADTPKEKQTLLFSATMSPIIRNIAKKYMHAPHEISVGKKNVGADKVVHQYYLVKPGQKYEALRRALDSEPDVYGILFCRTRAETQEIADRLKEDRYSTEALHGEVPQNLRTLIMERFRQRKVQLLVATDVAARGIDVDDLTHVINYNLPDMNDTYVHRSGRTGRAHKSGISLSILTGREMRKIHDLERKIGKPFQLKKVPSGEKICEKQLLSLVERMKNIEIDEKEIAPFMPAVEKILGGLTREELLTRFVSAEFNHFLNLYKNAKDFESVPMEKQTEGAGGARRDQRERQPDENFINVRLNIGKKDKLDTKTLFGLINAQKELKGAEIGKIKMMDSFTVFGIDKTKEADIARSFRSARFHGKEMEATVIGDFKMDSPKRNFSDRKRSGGSGRLAARKGGSGSGRSRERR
ncbi:MAG: DEAD/DEAH box helicase [Parcubacteria group bacterium]|jgi:ATP-dependent RNA helicase DeaD